MGITIVLKRRVMQQTVCVLLAVVSMMLATSGSAQDSAGVRVSQIESQFYLLSADAGNMILFVGEDASVIAGIQAPSLVSRARELIVSLKAPPVRYVLIMESDSAPLYRDGGWGQDGAVTLAHELLNVRMRQLAQQSLVSIPQDTAPGHRHDRPDRLGVSSDRPSDRNDPPMITFSQVVQVRLTGEDIHFVYERPGYTNADALVHFEEAGLVYLGNRLTTDGYPNIDISRGGSLAGIITAIEFFTTNFADNPEKIEPIVPGRGPLATMRDLYDYQHMLISIRDSVRTLVEAGNTLEEVVAANPTREFDARWGHGPVTPLRFTTVLYELLSR